MWCRKLCILLCCLVASGCAIAQSSTMDSLMLLIEDNRLADTIRSKAYEELLSRKHAYEAFQDVIRFDSIYSGELEGVMTTKAYCNVGINVGLALYNAGEYGESISRLKSTYDVAEQAGDTVAMIRALIMMGNNHLERGDYSEAVEVYSSSVSFSKRINLALGVSIANTNLGLTYSGMGHYRKALEVLVEGLQFEAERGRVSFNSYNNIGLQYNYLGKDTMALSYFLKAKSTITTKRDSIFLPVVQLHLSNTYTSLGRLDSAKYFLFAGASSAALLSHRRAFARSQWMLGDYYLEKNMLDSALYYGEKGVDLGRELEKKELIQNALRVVQAANEEKGNYREALVAFKELSELNDSLNSQENRNAIARLQAESKEASLKAAQEYQLQEALNRQKRRSQLLIFFTVTGLLFFGLIFYVRVERQRQQALLEKQELLHSIDRLKEKMATQMLIRKEKVNHEVHLDKEKLEDFVGAKIGVSSWNILRSIVDNPGISNKELAQHVFLSVEGVSSSLRRMYKAFDVQSQSSKNLKIALVTKVVKVSLEGYGQDEDETS